jgi:hypothetical protein
MKRFYAATLLIRADSFVSISGIEAAGFHVNKIGGSDRPYTVYFAAEFNRPFQSAKTWDGNDIHDEGRRPST